MLWSVNVGEDEEAFSRQTVACLVRDMEAGLTFPADGDGGEESQGLLDHSGGKGELIKKGAGLTRSGLLFGWCRW